MKRTTASGFTIIEIMVVVAIIGVLAALTVFAFGNWRARTAKTEVLHEMANASAAVNNYKTFNNGYPTTAVYAAGMYSPGGGVALTYTLRSGGASYCLKGQSSSVNSVVWYIDTLNSTQPTQTACT